MSYSTLVSSVLVALVVIADVHAETHTITFVNKCGSGTVDTYTSFLLSSDN